MVKITAAEVSKLRKSTGAGMMSCKKALVEAEGDFDKAIEILRKNGLKNVAKRDDNETSEGVTIAKISDDATSGVVISLNCETEPVTNTDQFVALKKAIESVALNSNTKEELLAQTVSGKTISDMLDDIRIAIQENINVAQYARIDAPFIGGYTHGGKISSIVGLNKKNEEVGKDIAMQVASMNPTSLSYKDLDPAYVTNETEARIVAIKKDNEELARLGKPLKNIPQFISRSQLSDEVIAQAEEDIKAELKAEGKPEAIFDKIVPGKLQRFISDNTSLDKEQCLLDQDFIKDEKKTVQDYVKANNIEITGFKRVSLS
ncbi:MAG: translation elongation factor Ts [Flavobacteriales bacterium]